jgi:hypothetical protein
MLLRGLLFEVVFAASLIYLPAANDVVHTAARLKLRKIPEASERRGCHRVGQSYRSHICG